MRARNVDLVADNVLAVDREADKVFTRGNFALVDEYYTGIRGNGYLALNAVLGLDSLAEHDF